MAYEWKDAITPVVTIVSVWIGARLALRNDTRKKAIELEIERLERLAVECDLVLHNLHKQVLIVNYTLQDFIETSVAEVAHREIHDAIKDYKDAGFSLNFEEMAGYQNGLAFHRPFEFNLWKETVHPLLLHLRKTMKYQPIIAGGEQKETFWSRDEIFAYCITLAELHNAVVKLRPQLVKAFSDDYRKQFRSEPANFWRLKDQWLSSVKDFFRKPPVPPT